MPEQSIEPIREAGDTQLLVDKATAISSECRSLPRAARIDALYQIASAIEKRRHQFATAIVRSSRKPKSQALGEVSRASGTFRQAAITCVSFAGEEFHFDQVRAGLDRCGWWSREPIGVILGVTPFNDPLNLVAHKIAPAIAVGAPVIIKPHQATHGVAKMLGDLCARANLPDGMVQCVDLSKKRTLELASHPKIAMLSFTGGRLAAAKLSRAAAGKQLQMELGGVGISLVAHSADTKRAANCLISGVTSAAGQNCIHTQHIIVHTKIADELIRSLANGLANLKIGDPDDPQTEVGPLIDLNAAKKARARIKDAVKSGARLITGGGGTGCFVEPTLLCEVPDGHSILCEEQFAPIATIEKTGSVSGSIENLSQTADMINFSIFSNELNEILLAQSKINAGTIIVNDSTDFRIDAMPFGGNGNAGLGREGLRFAMEAMTAPKLICIRA